MGTISPNNSATGVAVGINIVATFSEKVTASTVNATTFKIEDNLTNPVAGLVTVAGNGLSATFNPSVGLANGTTYTVTLTSGITDLALNTLTPFTSIFTTEALAAPALAVSTSALDFGTGLINLTFDITNTGGGSLTWTISDNDSVGFLGTAPTSGSTTSETDTITVTANRSSLAAANYSATITVTSNGGTETVSVAMEVLASPVLAVSAPALDFGTGLTSLTFDITNLGGGNLTWNITDNDSVGFLGTAPTSGSTTSETDTITVTANRSSLAAANYSATITVASNGGSETVSVAMEVQAAQPAGTFHLKWGTSGSAFGQFDSPREVVVDNSGNVYVVDRSNHRIQKFDSSGNFVMGWGSEGTGPGQFFRPEHADIDFAGNIYVADKGNKRIQKFTSAGAFVTMWGTFGSGDGQFNNPQGVAVDGAGNVYVADTNNDRIQKFDSSGSFITKWVSDVAYDIAAASDGSIYVANRDDGIVQKVTSSGALVLIIGGISGADPGQFRLPSGVAVDSAGNVYVADRGNDRIQKFTSAGVFLAEWGIFGTGDGEFNTLQGVAVDGAGNVYVADTKNDRIQKFSSGE